MTKPWRLLALAAALTVTAGVGVGTAQTVIVRNAPPGTTIDVTFDGAAAGSAVVDAEGHASIAVKPASGGDVNTDVHVFVDLCDKVRRIHLIERGLQPPDVQGGCDRREIYGWFVYRRVTTFVVDLGGANPSLWLRQGPAPPEWFMKAGPEGQAPVIRRLAPKGLVLFGGGGFMQFSSGPVSGLSPVSIACGNVGGCEGSDFRLGYTAGADFWFTRFAAVSASFMRPRNIVVNGSGTNFTFDSSQDTRLFTVVGKGAVPVGVVRIYGEAGVNYHQAFITTNQTIQDVTVTVDDVPQTFAGGTQTFQLKTEGWSWLFGGGIEGWVSRSVAIYAEGGRAALKGKAVGGGEGSLDDRAFFVFGGIRVHIAPK